MSNTLEIWRRDHANFLRLLELLETQINLFHKGRTPNYWLARDIIYYMTHYPDLFHHPKEDLVYDRIRAMDPSVRVVTNDLMRQHVVLRESGSSLLENLEAIIGGAMLQRVSVEAIAETYVAYFRHHMYQEESEIFPVAEKLLSETDWRALDAAAPSRSDPLFGHLVQKQYLALHEHIVEEANIATAKKFAGRYREHNRQRFYQ